MKKTGEIKGRRYYQGDMGIFVDIARYKGETVLSIGSDVPRAVRLHILENMPAAARVVCCKFAADESVLTDKECMEVFEKIYWKFASAYIFFFISDDFGIQPFQDGEVSLDMSDFSELEIRRYEHKVEDKKYYLDVELDRDPNNPEDVITNMYIMDQPGDRKTLCDRYAYEIPEENYKEVLKNNMDQYILTFNQEEKGDIYSIPYHKKFEADKMSNCV